MVVVIVLGCLTGSVALAVVPPSLQPRQQEAAVEAIIQELEAKVQAQSVADGTWSCSAGPQDQPAAAQALGFKGARWYVRSTQGNANDVLFSDGAEFYELPGRYRFCLDTAERGSRLEYTLRYYLLHVNLRPRQFLGAAGGLRVLGNETIDGVQYTRLQADPANDASAKADPKVKPKSSPRPVIDYWYDPARKAMAKLSITTDRGWRADCTVLSWDRFETGADWPKTMMGRRWSVHTANKAIDPPQLVTVASFARGDDPEVDNVQNAIANTPFFAPVVEDLRMPAVYAAAVQASPDNLSDRLSLTIAHLLAGQMRDGLAQWDVLNQRVTEAAAQQRLADAMIPSASESLAGIKARGLEEPLPAAQLVKRLTELLQTDAQWHSATPGLFEAWRALRVKPSADIAELLDPLQGQLITRFASHGDVGVLAGLIEVAAASATDTQLMDPALDQAAAAPLPASGYGGSRLSLLVAAALREQQWERAGRYLAAAAWHADTPADGRAPAQLVQAMLGQFDRARAGEAVLGGVLVDQFAQASAEGFAGGDGQSRYVCRELAITLGVEAVQAKLLGNAEAATPSQLVAASAGKPQAAAYWDQVVIKLPGVRPPTLEDPHSALRACGEIGAAVQQQGIAEAEAKAWLRVARHAALGRLSPLARIDYFNRAFTAATTDQTRIEAMREIVGVFEGLGRHDEALQAIDGLKPSLTSAEGQKSSDELAARVQQDRTVYVAAAQQRQKQIDIERIDGQIANLRERLREAEERSMPQAHVQAIQQMIDASLREREQMQAGG